jgi:hypothetical protein
MREIPLGPCPLLVCMLAVRLTRNCGHHSGGPIGWGDALVDLDFKSNECI